MRSTAFALALLATSFARSASAAPAIGTVVPADAEIVGDSLQVQAAVSGPYVVTGVTAKVGVATAPMTLQGSTWRATMDLSAEPIAPATLTITATDASGDTAVLTRALVHDRAPSLTVLTSPLSVARPSLRLRATCADSDAYGCATVAVAVRQSSTSNPNPQTVLATAVGSALDQTVSLAAYEGMAVDVLFTATDTAGAKTTTILQAYVESSPNLALVDEVDGQVLDVDATRILFVDDAGVHVKDRASGVSTLVGPGSPATETVGHLCTAGAVWSHGDWLGGVTTTRSPELVQANGEWAVRQPQSSDVGPVYRQDLTTGTVAQVSPTGAPIYGRGNVDAAGDVAYTRFTASTSSYDIHRVTVSGPDTVVVPSRSVVTSPVHPILDGPLVVFSSRHAAGRRSAILVLTPSGIVTLDPNFGGSYGFTAPYQSYRANGGWVAYNKVVGGTLTAWTRSPAGVEALASPLSDARIISGVSATGEVVYDVGTGTLRRHVSAAGPAAPTKPLAIGGANGSMRDVGGTWYELLGRAVLRVDPSGSGTTPEGGAPSDGGTTGDGGMTPDGGPPSDASAPAVEAPPSGGSVSSSSGAAAPSDDGGVDASAASCAVGRPSSGVSLAAALAVAGVLLRRRRGSRGAR